MNSEYLERLKNQIAELRKVIDELNSMNVDSEEYASAVEELVDLSSYLDNYILSGAVALDDDEVDNGEFSNIFNDDSLNDDSLNDDSLNDDSLNFDGDELDFGGESLDFGDSNPFGEDGNIEKLDFDLE